jgi:hypothetical protein
MKLDQFYTKEEEAQRCYELVRPYTEPNTIWLEPSAGTGAFFKLFPSTRLGYDLEPKFDGIIEGDFLLADLSTLLDQDVITVGNPPFGKNANLAVQFFNRCAAVSRVVAMIVPRTFRKPSIINRLDSNFHLVHDETLPSFSFIADDMPYDVPCCFQIWTRSEVARSRMETPTRHPDFIFCKRHEGDFAVQRVGAAAGKVKDISDSFKDPSHYFIKDLVGGVRAVLEQIDYSSVKFETAGNPSVSKGELIALYDRMKP